MLRFGRKTWTIILWFLATTYVWIWTETYYHGDVIPPVPLVIATSEPAHAPSMSRAAPTSALVDDLPPKSYRCQKINGPVSINGRGSDPAWRLAPWTDFFIDIEGDKKPRPRFLTRAKMLWSDEFLYVYAELEEPDLWASLTRKNSVIYHDNDFEVFMDPDSSGENYYEYEMNALNTVWELTLVKRYTRGGPVISPTNLPGLVSAVHVDGTLNNPGDVDHGWSVEIAFPFKSLATHRRNGSSPPHAGDRWRINFSRVEWTYNIIDGKYHHVPRKREDNWVWSPQGLIDMHQPEHWGYLDFVQ